MVAMEDATFSFSNLGSVAIERLRTAIHYSTRTDYVISQAKTLFKASYSFQSHFSFSSIVPVNFFLRSSVRR